ncbi:MAG: polymer-forming cytoskeletal protein [Deltaproteobacteria bacterium]|nr:polymer-forming cytoskeletal protein [Deltaproteobacteria bacterium]
MLGRGTEFDGKLTFEGTVRIDGKFKGEVFTKGVLVIGESATVHAEIEAEIIIISGEVHGNLKALNRIEIHSPGKLYGNIKTSTLIVEEGVMFEGSCQMGEKEKKVAIAPVTK